MDELKEKAAPKAKELADKFDMLYKEMVINNIILADILQSKADQAERDAMWREKWKKAKGASARVTLAQVLIGSAALYLGVIDVNRDNAIVQSLTEAAISFMRMF